MMCFGVVQQNLCEEKLPIVHYGQLYRACKHLPSLQSTAFEVGLLALSIKKGKKFGTLWVCEEEKSWSFLHRLDLQMQSYRASDT